MAVAKINDFDKTAMKAMFDEAVGKFASAESTVKDSCVITNGVLRNDHGKDKDLVIIDQHDWLGNPTPAKPYPNPLIRRTNDSPPDFFSHQGSTGSKAGVVYADGEDSTARKWLVAFDNIDNKVYVEAGPIGPIDWDVVAVRLSKSTPVHYVTDPVHGGEAYAEMRTYVYGRFLFAHFWN